MQNIPECEDDSCFTGSEKKKKQKTKTLFHAKNKPRAHVNFTPAGSTLLYNTCVTGAI